MAIPLQRAVRPVLLQALRGLGGRARPSDIYPLVTREFPEVQPADLTAVLSDGHTNRWQNRIQWARQDLVLLGLIDASERGVWKLTPHGQELAEQDVSEDYLTRAKAQRELVARRTRVTPAEPVAPDEVPATEDAGPAEGPADQAGVVTALQSRPESLVQELQGAAVDSKDPNRLERAVAEAFHFLGFSVEWIGGPGRTDVLLRAPLGIRRYSVVVDAKSTGRTRVTDGQVDWLSIKTHRELEHAQHACVVGLDFAGGQLLTRASEFEVALLTVAEVAELVRLHAETPLTLTEMRTIFTSTPVARDVLPQLRAAARDRRRKRLLIGRLLRHIDALNQAEPDDVLAKPDTLFGSIVVGEANRDLAGTTREDVRRALTLLETIGAITAVNGEGYVSETSVDGAFRLLAAFGSPPEQEVTEARSDSGLPHRSSST